MNGSKSWWLPCFSAQSNTCAKICNTVYVISSATFSFLQRKKQNAFFTIVFVTTNSRCGTRGCSVEVKWAISYVIICRFVVKPFSNQTRTLKSGLIFYFTLFLPKRDSPHIMYIEILIPTTQAISNSCKNHSYLMYTSPWKKNENFLCGTHVHDMYSHLSVLKWTDRINLKFWGGFL